MGREGFAAQAGRALADRDVVILHPGVLRRLDRIDTVVVEAAILASGRSALGRSEGIGSLGAAGVLRRAQTLFGLGLPGASALAGAVVPLSTSYAISEALGVERSVSRRFSEAPLFLSLFTAQIVVGAAVALTPVNLIRPLIGTQVLQGLLTQVVLVFILLLANRQSVLGRAANGPVSAPWPDWLSPRWRPSPSPCSRRQSPAGCPSSHRSTCRTPPGRPAPGARARRDPNWRR